jgi:hypothetical protein
MLQLHAGEHQPGYATGEQKILDPVAKLLRLVISLDLALIDVNRASSCLGGRRRDGPFN